MVGYFAVEVGGGGQGGEIRVIKVAKRSWLAILQVKGIIWAVRCSSFPRSCWLFPPFENFLGSELAHPEYSLPTIHHAMVKYAVARYGVTNSVAAGVRG